ncbi:MAG: F0F1 ATP synthase subunit B' [Paracoccus sp. (in: a-proteobacteria)]|nr:F0F1 ATP synthase subunit B' [Paracoccus sp. (in: a-proteobacteria)]
MFSLLQQVAPTAATQTPAASDAAAVDTAPVTVDGVHHVELTTGLAADTAPPAGAAMPQLDVSTFGNQIFWLLITLAIIYWVLSKIALPRIGAVLSDRQGAITADLGAAEEFKLKAKEAEAAYDKALADARAEAGKIVAQQRAEIQDELNRAIAHADAEIAARTAESETRIREIRASAEEDARSVAQDVTADLVRHFGGRADDAEIASAVDQRMKGSVQ